MPYALVAIRNIVAIAPMTWTTDQRCRTKYSSSSITSANQMCGEVRNQLAAKKTAMPVRLPSTSTVYASTRLGIASNARPIVCPSPMNVIAISAKNVPATASTGTMNRLGSFVRYSVPK
jgi:hypothetical protein